MDPKDPSDPKAQLDTEKNGDQTKPDILWGLACKPPDTLHIQVYNQAITTIVKFEWQFLG